MHVGGHLRNAMLENGEGSVFSGLRSSTFKCYRMESSLRHNFTIVPILPIKYKSVESDNPFTYSSSLSNTNLNPIYLSCISIVGWLVAELFFIQDKFLPRGFSGFRLRYFPPTSHLEVDEPWLRVQRTGQASAWGNGFTSLGWLAGWGTSKEGKRSF